MWWQINFISIISLLIHLITSIQVFSVTFRTFPNKVFFSFLFFYMWSNPLCLILNIHYTWKLITHFSKKWFALICLGNMKDVWQFFWDIFGIHLRPLRRFWGAYLFSKSANSIFKILIDCSFWRDDFLKLFKKCNKIST